jgi:GxxExxY protein
MARAIGNPGSKTPLGPGWRIGNQSGALALQGFQHVSTPHQRLFEWRRISLRRAVCDPGGMFKDIAGHEGLTRAIIGCGIQVHGAFGPGLLEAIYKECLLIELQANGRRIDRTRKLRLVYKGHDLQTDFWPDIVVDDAVVVELKAVERIAPVHTAQVITYLKLTGLPVGLLMNFNVPLLQQGVTRLVRPDLLLRT